jgi:hypothetical protein
MSSISSKLKKILVNFSFFAILFYFKLSAEEDSVNSICGSFSAADNEDYWDAVRRCNQCTDNPDCGYCLSTLQCLTGTDTGPGFDIPCPSWTFSNSSCPVVPNCGDFFDCRMCAVHDQCAWCASEGVCTTISEAFSKDCHGLVFEPPCPDSFVTENIIVGNLVVRADPLFGGGEINISGSSVDNEGKLVHFGLIMNRTNFHVSSGGNVDISGGNRTGFNGVGGNVTFVAGSGLNSVGGR